MSRIRWVVLALGCALRCAGQLPGLDGVPVEVFGGTVFPAPYVPVPAIDCVVRSAPLTVRAEGLAEMLGDIEIVCRGILQPNRRNRLSYVGVPAPTAAAAVATINIGIALSVPLTSRLVQDPLTEALLFVDDPVDASPVGGAPDARRQNPCAAPGGVCVGLVAHDGQPGSVVDGLEGAVAAADSTGQVLNVFQGSRLNNQTVSFAGIPLSNYDTRANPRLLKRYNEIKAAGGGVYRGEAVEVPWVKRFRIKNLCGAIAGAAAPNGQVFANVQIQNPPATLRLNSSTPTVGFVQQGLFFQQRGIADGGPVGNLSLSFCQPLNPNLAADPTNGAGFSGQFLAQFVEGYAGAYRTRGYQPGQLPAADQSDPLVSYPTESGWYNTRFPQANGLNRAGLADQGTRLRMVLNNVPASVSVFASVSGTTGSSLTMGAYAVREDATGANLLSALPVTPTAQPVNLPAVGPPLAGFVANWGFRQGVFPVSIFNGRGSVLWEIYAEGSPRQAERLNFMVAVAYRTQAAAGTATLAGTFGPINTTATASLVAPVPRFVEAGSPADGFTVTPSCVPRTISHCPDAVPPGAEPFFVTIRSAIPAFDATSTAGWIAGRAARIPVPVTIVDSTEARLLIPGISPLGGSLDLSTGGTPVFSGLGIDATVQAPARICSAEPRVTSAGVASLPLRVYGLFPGNASVFPAALMARMGAALSTIDVTVAPGNPIRTEGAAIVPGVLLRLAGPVNLLESNFNFRPVTDIRVNDAVTLSTLAPPPIVAGRGFTGRLIARGGVPPYRWSVTNIPEVRLAAVPGAADQQDLVFQAPANLIDPLEYATTASVTDSTPGQALTASTAIAWRAEPMPVVVILDPNLEPGGTHIIPGGAREMTVVAGPRRAFAAGFKVTFQVRFTTPTPGPAPAVGLIEGQTLVSRVDRIFGACANPATCGTSLRLRGGGNVAGRLVLTAELTEAGGLPPAGAAPSTFQFEVPEARPQLTIEDVTVSREAANLLVCVAGITNTRQMNEVEFRFAGAPGSGFNATLRAPDAVDGFRGYFESPPSAATGGSFRYWQSFTVSGDALNTGAVFVRLANRAGATEVGPVAIATERPCVAR